MEYYVLTALGTEAIPSLRKAKRDEEAVILELAGKTDGVTVEQVAYRLDLPEGAADDKLRTLASKKWLWKKVTKFSAF